MRISARNRVARRLIGGLLVISLLIGYVWWLTGDDPDEVVRKYLAALHRGDATAALKIAGAKRPGDRVGAFLTDAALAGEWTVAKVAVTGKDGDTVRVDYDLRPDDDEFDAKMVTTNSLELDKLVPLTVHYGGTFELKRSGRSWRIVNPFGTVAFDAGPLDYVQIGDVLAPASGRSTRFRMFPGLYRPYARSGELVAVPVPALVVRAGKSIGPYRPQITVKAKANQQYQPAFDAAFDHCVAELPTGPPTDEEPTCVIVTATGVFRSDEGDVRAVDLQKATWTTVRRPTVSLEGGIYPTGVFEPGPAALKGQVLVPGILRLDATGRNADGATVRFRMTCLVDTVEPLPVVARFLAPYSMVTRWKSQRPVEHSKHDLDLNCR